MNRGPERPKLTIDWPGVREVFIEWLGSKNYCKEYFKRIIRELDRYIEAIDSPLDVARAFRGLSFGQQQNLNRAVRALFNFYEETMAVDELTLKPFRKSIPREQIGVDLRIPDEQEIAKSIRNLPSAPSKYQALYNLLLDSGLRIAEAVRLMNNFNMVTEVEENVYRCTLGYFRGSKHAYFAYLTEPTLQSIKQVDDRLNAKTSSHYFAHRGFVSGKYVRKFAFDKMIQLGIPESVADFIQGRVPMRIGAKHYMSLARRADQFYTRYSEYVIVLRQKCNAQSIDPCIDDRPTQSSNY